MLVYRPTVPQSLGCAIGRYLQTLHQPTDKGKTPRCVLPRHQDHPIAESLLEEEDASQCECRHRLFLALPLAQDTACSIRSTNSGFPRESARAGYRPRLRFETFSFLLAT